MKHKKYLIHAVLASAVLITPVAFADTTVNGNNSSTAGPITPPLKTSAAGNIEVTSTGQVSGTATDAIQIDSTNGIVVLDLNNNHTSVGHPVGVAVTATSPGIGVNITTGTSATVNIQSNTAIDMTFAGDNGSAIQIAADMAMINNAGTLYGSQSAVYVVTGGTNATITNQLGGVMKATDSYETVKVSEVGSTVTNSGTILAPPAVSAVIYDASFNQLNNTATGVIDGTPNPNGNTINLRAATTGSVINSGDIQITNSPAGTAALNANGPFTGTIINNAGNNCTTTTPTGCIQSLGTGTALIINSPITSLMNAGMIQAKVAGGTALVISAGATTGTITNTGTILSQNTNTVQIGGSITQLNNSGTIQAAVSGKPIVVTAAGITLSGGIVNSGNITSAANTGIFAIDLFNTFANVNIPLVQNGGTVKGDVNLDTFGNPLNGIVFNMTGGTITGFVRANGATSDTLTISGGTIGGTTTLGNNNDTLNLSGGTLNTSGNANGVVGGTGNDTYNISGGIITNNLTDTSGTNKINMSGGLITGSIVFGPGGGPNTLNLQGGIVSGNANLSNSGDTVNLGWDAVNLVPVAPGTTVVGTILGGAGNDTFNVGGGSFGALNGAGGANVLNVNATFASTGPISNVQTINVHNLGTVFTVNFPITNMNTKLTTDIGTGIVFNTNIPALGTGDIQNNGSFQVNNGFTVTDTGGAFTSNGNVTLYPQSVLQVGTFTQNPGASYSVGIQNPFNGQIQTTGNVILNGGSTVSPFLTPGNFFVAGSTFDIIKAPLGGVLDASTLVQPSSVIIFFTKSGLLGATCGANTCVELTAGRRPYEFAATTPVAIAVAATLDGIVPLYPNINPDILAAMEQIDLLTSVQAVNSALEMLAPGFNYAMIGGTHQVMSTTFESLQHRLEDLKGLHPASTIANYKYIRDEMLYNGVDVEQAYEEIEIRRGVNLGDNDGNVAIIRDIYADKGYVGAWIKVDGDFLNQKTKENITGYQGEGTWLTIGADYRASDCAAIGAAITTAKEDVHDTTLQRNTVDIQSFLTTFYGWFEPIDSLYIDSMIGFAAHKYTTTRNIAFGTFARTATASFYGLEYGAQVDVGYAFLSSDNFYTAPFVRLKYTYLTLDNYTETGAGGVDLNVINQSLDEAIAGAGVRFAIRKDFVTAIYVPELSAAILYDFSGAPQEMQSNFLGGGNPFYITGLKPAQVFYLFGLGINAHTNDNYTFTLRNTLEVRDHFLGYDIYAELHYTWD